jgi:hypothetical protein
MTEIEHLPCVDCGCAVENPTRKVTIVSAAREIGGDGGPVLIRPGAWEFYLTRCDTDQARLWRAESIAEEHPAVVRKLGSKQYAIDMIDAALIGLVNLSRTSDEWEQFVYDDRSLLRLVRRLGGPALNLRWTADIAPVTRLGADTWYPGRAPWAHVTEERTQALRDAFAPILWDQLGLPRKFVPPEDGLRGCLYCGVDHIDVGADAGEEAWGELRGAHPGTLGGRPTPETRKGYLCPPCGEAVETVGVMGPTSLALALMNFLGVRAPEPDLWLPGLQAWAVFPIGSLSNSEPWAHISDLSEVREMIRNADRAEMAKPNLDGRIVAKI